MFYKHIATKSNSQTGEFLADKISDVISQIGAKKVLGVCTDNASYCQKAWRLIEEKYKDDQIFGYGCSAHVLNLLVGDICKQPAANLVLETATDIVKEIKQSHILHATFTEIQKSATGIKDLTTLKLPAKTRWGSSLECFKSIDINKYNLKQLCISTNASRLKDITREIILKDDFWVKIKKMICILEPVVVWLKKVEGDESRISELPEIFCDLKEIFSKELETSGLAVLPTAETKKVIVFGKSLQNGFDSSSLRCQYIGSKV